MPAPTKDSAARRHKFTSLAAKSKAQHVSIVKKQLDFTPELEESEGTMRPELLPSPFSLHLAHLSLLNLSLPFQALHKKLVPLSETFPLLLFNSVEVIDLFVDVLSRPDEPDANGAGAIPAALELLPPLAQSLLGECLPHLKKLLPPFLALAQSPIHLPLLFASLSGFLKPLSPLLLLPANDAVLQDVWAIWRPFLVLVSNGGEATGLEPRRLAVEGWGSVVRRGGRGEGGARLARMMMRDLLAEEDAGTIGLKDGVCLCFVEAMKGPSSTLHSRASHLVESLLSLLIPLPAESTLPKTVLRNILTALIHHVHSKPAGFEPVLEVLYTAAEKEIRTAKPSQTLHLERVLRIVSVVAGARKGKCVTSSFLPRFFSLLPPFLSANSPAYCESTPALRALYLSLASNLFPAGKLSDWLSHRNLVEGFWSLTDEDGRKALVGVFVDVEDGGWRGGGEVLVKPLVEKTGLQAIQEHPKAVLAMVGSLARSKVLETMGPKWREQLALGLGEVLVGLENKLVGNTESIILLASVLPLLPALSIHRSRYLPSLIRLYKDLLDNASTDSFDVTPANDIFALGSVCKTLGELIDRASEGANEILGVLLAKEKDSVTAFERALTKCSNHRVGLEGLARLAASLEGGKKLSSLKLSSVLPLLSSQLLSEDALLRQSALMLFAAVSPSSLIVKRALEVEECPLTIRDARERCLRIGKVARAVLALGGSLSDIEKIEVEIGIRALISQLKVNLRPLWPETCKSLAEISTVHAEAVWASLFTEVAVVVKQDHALFVAPLPDWADEDTFDEDAGNATPSGVASVFALEEEEEEKTFRDPWRRRSEERVARQMMGQAGVLREMAELQITSDRLDVLNYELELLHALAAAPAMPEKHSREIVPLFLDFARPAAVIEDETADVEMTDDNEKPALRLNVRQVHAKLGAFLELFAKFKGPKSLYQTEQLYDLYLSLLAKGELKIQKLALDCIFTYRSAKVLPYRDNLTMLLDDVRFRDQLAKFSLAVDGGSIDPAHRSDLIPILIRLLYGLMVTKRGRSSSSQGPQARKQAIISAFGGCTSEELATLVTLMLTPFQRLESEAGPSGRFAFSESGSSSSFIPGKQQIGFLSLLGDVLKHLGPALLPYWPRLLGTTMELIHRAQLQLSQKKLDAANLLAEADQAERDAEVDADDDDEDETSGGRAHHTAPTRTIRQLGLKRFGDFFRSPAKFDFSPYLPAAFSSFISPRVAALDAENTQAPSGLLELFATWATDRDTLSFLVEFDNRVLAKIYDCLTATNVKPAVISKIYDIIERLLAFSAEENDNAGYVCTRVIKPYVDGLLANLSILVETPVGAGPVREELAKRQIRVLSGLATYVTNGPQSAKLLGLLAPMLRKPAKVVPEKVKVDILNIFKALLPLVPEFGSPESDFFVHNYNLLATLFQLLRSRPARQALSDIFDRFAIADPTLRPVVDVVVSLNAFSERRREEPDFDRRLAAFALLNETLYSTLTVREWLPLMYNMLHFIQDPEELSIRSNAAYALRRFVEMVAQRPEDETFQSTFLRVLFPGLRNGLRSRIELVRTEILSVFAAATSLCVHIPLMAEMSPLLAQGDDEASFFTNIHHIQTHRRTRALRRLAELCDEGSLRSSTLADIFLPLIAHFITGAGDKTDHHLVNEAITTTGRISRQLAWGAYNALVRQYIRLAKEKTEQEKFFIRTVVALLDNFHFAMEDAVPEAEIVQPENADVDGTVDEPASEVPAAVAAPAEEVMVTDEVPIVAAPVKSQTGRIAEAVESRLLPSLLQYLEQKDETEDSIRLPIALGIVKVALNLPERSREAQISRLLTVLSQVFRSKSQETRDLAKDTIIKIAVTLGPEWLAQLVKEMKQALQRGPQLHILAFTVHAILVHVTSLASGEFGDLDDCVSDVVAIAAEVVFGESGKDLQAEGFKTKMREVRTSNSKGLDTFQLVARLISPAKMSQLLLPVREVLQTTEVLKVLQQVDDVLRRVASGLNSNERLDAPALLVLCHTLIGQNAQFLKPKAKSTKLDAGKAKKDFHVDIKRTVKKDVDHYAANAHKFVAFGLELFVTAFRRGRFDFANQEILARLDPLVNVIGNTLYAGDSQVIVLGLKATAALSKVPLETVETSLPTMVGQIFTVLRQAGGTESEVAQAALKTLAVVLRDCKGIEVKEKQLAYLLEVITPDLEDPSRQSTLFALLRSIISRKFVVADIYDLMDKVSEIMVTSQSTQVQELCRVSLMQFLLDYPQGRGRLKKQMQFLAKNLAYVYESGRLSVMELLGAIFHKFSVELVREYADLFFVALVMVIANDDSNKCRELAAELVKNLLPRLDEELLSKTVSTLHTWASQTSQPQLPRLASQVFGLVLDCLKADARPFASIILIDVQAILSLSASSLEAYETAQDDSSPFEMEIDEELDWQLAYQSLSTLAKLLKTFPDLVGSVEWSPVFGHLLFPHAWVRLAAARLVGTLFGSVPPAFDAKHISSKDEEPLQPRSLFDIARKSLLQLKGDSIDEALAMQVVKNVVYLGRCFALGPSIRGPDTMEEDAAAAEALADGVPLPPVEDGEQGQEQEEKAPIDEDEEVTEEEATRRALAHPLAWLFTKLSQLARTILISRPPVHGVVTTQRSLPVLSIFRLFAALASLLDPAQTRQFLMQILHPVQRVLDDDQKGDEEMRNLALELQTLIQDKVGVSAFSAVYNTITRGRAMKRQARRNERVVKTSTNPQFAAKRKEHKQELKKESHKRKIRGFADAKLRERPMKARRTRDPMQDDE